MAPATSPLISKIKVQLKLAISRLRMTQQKDEAVAKQQRRAMAQLLEQGKEESAKIRVENIIRSDITTELLEILELYCELLLARAGMMEAKECDPGLEEAVKSIIYAAPRTEIKELQNARGLLIEKYGKDFGVEAMENKEEKVSERVVKKLRVDPPAPELVMAYLEEIARAYGVPWPKREQTPGIAEDEDDDDEPGDGERVGLSETPLSTEELNHATPPQDFGPKSPVHVAPPRSRTDNPSPRVKLPGPPDLRQTPNMTAKTRAAPETPSKKPTGSQKDPIGGKIPDVDELAKRFAALKR